MKVPISKFEILSLVFIGIVIFTIVFFLFQKIILLNTLDAALLDEFIFLNGQRLPDNKVVIFALDDSSFNRFGNNTLNLRKQYVKLIRKLSLVNVKTIAFDILFARQMDPQLDSLLAHVTDSTQNVIHCFNFSDDTLNAQLIEDESYQKYAIEVINSKEIAITSSPYATFPDKKFINAFDHAGSFANLYDPDNEERRISLLMEFKGFLYPALTLSTLLHYFDVSKKSVEIETNFWGKYLVIKTPDRFIKIPINSRGQVLLNYYGFVEQFDPIPLWKVMDLLEHIQKNGSKNVTLPSLTGKIVFIGSFETGFDKHSTPFSVVFPGVARHATLSSNVLQGDLITEANWKINIIISAIISLLLFCTFFYYIKSSKSIRMFVFLQISLMLLFDLASYFIIFKIFYLWLKIVQINSVFIALFIVLLFYEKGYRLKKLNLQIKRLLEKLKSKSNELKRLNQNVHSQSELLKVVEYFTNQLSTMLLTQPLEQSKSFEELFPMIVSNLKIMKENLTNEIKKLKDEKEQLENERKALKSATTHYQRLIKKTTETTLIEPKIDKYQVAREILAAYQYFKAQQKDGFLEQFSSSNIIAIPSFMNENAEVTMTEMGKILEGIAKTSGYDSTVLITGENGTGKEVVARAIHKQSKRVDKPMLTLNCAAIPETLLESELFGTEKGAFSGAIDRKGAFKTADLGTIFLDEIGDLKFDLQAKLLRVIEDKIIQKVGSDKTIQADVRIITATNQNLEKCVENQQFRRDLYYRLNVVKFHLPPLRKRKRDIPFLIHHFFTDFNSKYNQQKSITREAMLAMMCYDWPGNVRQLQNLIEKLFVATSEDVVALQALPDEIRTSYNNIFKSPEVPLWQQIEESVQAEQEKLFKACKTAIIENKIDEFLQSPHLKINQKSQANCYEYFRVFIENAASIFPLDEQEKLARKMIVQIKDQLFQWRHVEKFEKSREFYPKIEKILGRTRRQIYLWEQELAKPDKGI